MRRATGVRIAFAIVGFSLIGYIVGAMRTPLPAGQQHSSTSTAASTAPAKQQTLDTWQKIIAKRSTTAQRETAKRSDDRRPDNAKILLPAGPFGSVIAELKQRAEAGDAEAAYALAKGFRACEFFVPSKNSAEAGRRAEDTTVSQLNLLDQVVDHANNQAAKQGKTLGSIPDVPVQQVYQGNLDAENEQTRQCAGVDIQVAKSDWSVWQKRAAEMGNIDAELAYWQVLLTNVDIINPADIVGDKQIVVTGLEDALSRRDPRALIAIAEVLQTGMFARPDPYLAYAYFYAAAQVPPADMRALPWLGNGLLARLLSGGDTQQYLQLQLARTAASLSRTQQLAAEQIGMDFFRQCCQGAGQ